jgi:superfamily I DNA/RNA helicase
VPRLAIASDFLAEYSRLEKKVQSAVTAAIGKFESTFFAGAHLEKLNNSKDHRIRTIRIDSYWRGVVLAPDSGDTYCLITVLPHDKAIAYATNRLFSVNQVLGVLEVRDEVALQQMQPALQAVAEADSGRLFGHVSDKDLTRLGVDSSVLPVVRLLTSDAHLEALQAMLPEAQYAALYALACGMTVEEAWQEVSQFLPAQAAEAPPAQPDSTDLVAAMERTPSRVAFVSGQEELERMLANPFAAWRVFLHPAQRKIAYAPSYSGPAQVTGGAGTGKTVTALHRAAHLAVQHGGQGIGTPVLLTTFTRGLADALEGQLGLLVTEPAVRELIEVLSVDRLAYRVVRAARGMIPVAEPGDVRQLWTEALTADGADLPFTAAFLQHEWEQVILGRDLRSEQEYLDCSRAGRGIPLSKVQRSQIWQAAQHVERELTRRGQFTHIQIAAEAARLLNDGGRPPYQHVVVDEGQDLHPAQWRLLRAAVPQGPDDMFIAADPNQRIYDNRVSLASLGIEVRGRSRRLRLNYRTTQEILAWAVPLLGSEPVQGLSGEDETLLGYRSLVHGRRPEVFAAASREEEFAYVAERVNEWLNAGIEPHAIGVATRSSHMAGQARAALKAAGIRVGPLGVAGTTDKIRVGTMHGMKGLEFQAVAVIGVEDGAVPAAAAVTPKAEDALAHDQDLQRERCVLFVACTRARDHLSVSYVGQPSPFLSRGAV